MNIRKFTGKRSAPSISINKIVTAINLFEEYVDEEITEIALITKNYYEIKTYYSRYSVDISTNKLSFCHPDPE